MEQTFLLPSLHSTYPEHLKSTRFHLEFVFILMHLCFAVTNIWDNFRQPHKNMVVHMVEQMPEEKL